MTRDDKSKRQASYQGDVHMPLDSDSMLDSDEFEDGSLDTGPDKVYQNYMMPGLELYDAKVTINHWQLRDCINHDSRNQSKLYYIYDHSIMGLDTNLERYNGQKIRRHSVCYANSQRKTVGNRRGYGKSPNAHGSDDMLYSLPNSIVDFNFKPRCFTENYGLIACGGLIGSDDKGYPSNWNKITNKNDERYSFAEEVSPPASMIKISSDDVLRDHSTYGNSNIWKGILSIFNGNTGYKTSLIMGQFINNCIRLHRDGNTSYKLFSCNNDGHLYQCQISNNGTELVKRYSDLNFPLNNVALSHDGNKMIVSGDSNKFAIYKQSQLSDAYTLSYDNLLDGNHSRIPFKVKQIPKYTLGDNTGTLDHNVYESTLGDHGFYNCFSENDLQFATLYQNGLCLVYDIRKMEEPIAEINSTTPVFHRGAFRVCKFSYGLDDLLFISEHQGRVHIVDTRNFENHQVILIPDQTSCNEPTNNNLIDRTNHHFRRIPAMESSWTRNGIVNANNQSTNRRFSYPSNNGVNDHKFYDQTKNRDLESWVTEARFIPNDQLQPTILPYPDVVGKLSNKSAIDKDKDSHGEQKGFSFRVRRVSTSSSPKLKALSRSMGFALKDDISKSNINREIGQSFLDSRFTHGSVMDNDTYDPYNDVNDFDYTSQAPTSFNHYDYVRSTNQTPSYSAGSYRNNFNANSNDNNEDIDGNNISGIDWIDNENGSSLIIGTQYGIMKWNINSWARRSFASYDFC